MIVFKTFLKVLNKCKMSIILYTVILIVFGGLNLQTSDDTTNFVAVKPKVLIINNDEEKGLTRDLIKYISKNTKKVNIKDDENAIRDALFYRDVNYIIYIPNNFRSDFLNGKDPKIIVESTGDYNSSLANILLNKYLKTANLYNKDDISENELIKNINMTLDRQSKVEVMSKLDVSSLARVTFYFNFMNYSLLAGCIYVICLVLTSFRNKTIKKRTVISSMNYNKYNKYLLLSNGLFALILWLFYILLGLILLGNIMFTIHGLIYIINSFIFMLCSLSLAFLLGNIITDKNALNGIINVIALGSSFLCGAFVPMDLLPEGVLLIGRMLPSYWFIKSNELIKTLDIINLSNLKPIMINMFVIIIFTILFVFISNFISKRRRKIG